MNSEAKLQEHLSKKPYLIDAIAGNSEMLVSLGRTGRLYRLWWPHIDIPQHVDEIRTGLKWDGAPGGVSWFDDAGDGWSHDAGYVPRSNAYRVTASHPDAPVTVEQTDFAVPGKPIFVRLYRLTYRGEGPGRVSFVHYGSFRIADNELFATTEFRGEHDALLHFRHEYAFAVGSSSECAGYQAGGGARHAALRGETNGNTIDMQSDGVLEWDLGTLTPGTTVELPIYYAAGMSRGEALDALAEAKSIPAAEWLADTLAYWDRFLANAAPCPGGGEEIRTLYERSLLAMKLMADEKTGTIVAAPEFDEYFTRCGGYGYSWGRDAAFVTTAFNAAGLGSLSEKFYDWAVSAQEPDGSWQQRHYHDGRLAPSWGLQIDEGASLLWGMWEYFVHSGEDEAFLARMWPAVEKGAAYLAGFIDPETGLPLPSRDLWEEREAEHTYSAAAVYGGLTAAASFARRQGRDDLAQAWDEAARGIAKSVEDGSWNEAKSSYYRGRKITVSKEAYDTAIARGEKGEVLPRDKAYVRHVLEFDPIVDVSLLGLSVPFGMVPAGESRMAHTADAVEKLLTSHPVGGIRRYEDDSYIGGNPWILTTLWLGHFRTLQGRYDEARKLLDYALDHVTESGLLPEQVDKETGGTAWVVPLTWSHAMFILAVHMLAEKQELHAR
ncbi:glycoside hydrolase family 15 protein [Cohnella candidum]|uniref:Glycoside hydrolase family 15 n=1 Tax=Cohnella candidum TaxID=2674991 RepID=A0A3G3JXY9_9BACL|nr:glycoside hydrolase family 15 protein [Cohnella candidum]AYQ73104.1 glycoside hydrolase family 15 [Cohnella candidum]